MHSLIILPKALPLHPPFTSAVPCVAEWGQLKHTGTFPGKGRREGIWYFVLDYLRTANYIFSSFWVRCPDSLRHRPLKMLSEFWKALCNLGWFFECHNQDIFKGAQFPVKTEDVRKSFPFRMPQFHCAETSAIQSRQEGNILPWAEESKILRSLKGSSVLKLESVNGVTERAHWRLGWVFPLICKWQVDQFCLSVEGWEQFFLLSIACCQSLTCNIQLILQVSKQYGQEKQPCQTKQPSVWFLVLRVCQCERVNVTKV